MALDFTIGRSDRIELPAWSMQILCGLPATEDLNFPLSCPVSSGYLHRVDRDGKKPVAF